MKENTSIKRNPSEFDILDVVKERASASSSGARPAATMNGDMEKEIEKQRAMELGPAVGRSLNSNGQTRAKERSISAVAADTATTATTRMCCTGDDGSTTMAPQKEENTIHAEESKMASGSGLPHKTGSSYAVKHQETNSAPEEVLDILDVVRERQLTTDSSSLGIRYQKEMEKQKKNCCETITSKSHSNNNPTSNDVAGGEEGSDTNKKMINNEQQNHIVAEEFDTMDAVLKRAALITNEESNDVVEVTTEPPHQSGEGKRTVNSIASQPGAYSGAPGEGLQRRDDMRFSLVGVLGDEVLSNPVLEDKTTEKEEDIGVAERTNHNEPILTNTDQSPRLSEATPVYDDDCIAPDVEAQPFDVDEAEKRKSTSERTYRAKLGLMAIIILAVVATVVGLVMKHRHKEGYHSAIAPSVAPSNAPSAIPSSAPTSSLDLMLAGLPQETIEKLGNSSTPQWMASDWLSRHPELPGMPEWRKMQLFSLATFFYAMEGPNWPELIRDRWMQYAVNECYWYTSSFGNLVDGKYEEDFFFNSTPCNENGEFEELILTTSLDLSEYHPFLPPEISHLGSLSSIVLEGCGIHAPLADFLPDEIFSLSNLVRLLLPLNALTGTVPTELGLMSSITLLQLHGNLLSGEVPSELGAMRELQGLYMPQNMLSGSIPTVLGLLSNINAISLWGNSLTASVPPELGLLSNMIELALWENALTGAIPTVLGLLSNMKKLYLNNNQLTGPIPTELGLMTNMERLQLVQTSLKSQIPTELGLMTNLFDLRLFSNALFGPIPSELGLLTNLVVFPLHDNALTGSIPEELFSLKNVTRFYLRTNNLSGSISTEMGLMTNLVDLSLSSNFFSALIPSEVGLLTSLGRVWFHNNSLTGPVPQELELLAMNGSLGLLTLENNNLSGIVPERVCSLSQYNDSLGFGLSFDCAEQLCGCDWCLCGSSSSSNGSVTQGVNNT